MVIIGYDDFAKVDMRAGRVVYVEEFERAHKPSYKAQVDFGLELGMKWSSLQARDSYTKDAMLGRFVISVVNLPPKNIAGFMSEVLVLAVPSADGGPALLTPCRPPKLGGRVY